MNKKHMLEWAEALESGKYTQCDGALRQGEGGKYSYCCLGVAEVLAGSKFNQYHYINYINDVGHEDTENEFLSPAGVEWLGVDGQNPELIIPPHLLDEHIDDDYVAASILNDDYEFDFKKIAECIRHTVENDNGS